LVFRRLGSGRVSTSSSLSKSMSITCCVLATAAGLSFLNSIFMPGTSTTVEIIVVVVVPVLSMMLVMEVGLVVVMDVTSVEIPAVGGTAVGTVVSILAGVSGIGSVVSAATRLCSSQILLKSSLLWYLVVCFVCAIGWVSFGVVVLVSAVASLYVGGDEFNWARTQSS
jgi:hypothetical protein